MGIAVASVCQLAAMVKDSAQFQIAPYYDEDEERILNDVCVVFGVKINEKPGEA